MSHIAIDSSSSFLMNKLYALTIPGSQFTQDYIYAEIKGVGHAQDFTQTVTLCCVVSLTAMIMLISPGSCAKR